MRLVGECSSRTPTRTPTVYACLGASLLATTIAVAFGVSRGFVLWQREPGFDPLDPVRLLSAAGLVGGLPALVAVWVGQLLDRLDPTSLWARALFWSAPVAALVACGVQVATAPAGALSFDMPWSLLIAAGALIVLFGWRYRLFWGASGTLAPVGWLIAASGVWLLGLEWGEASQRFHGQLPFVLLGLLLAVALTGLGLLRKHASATPKRARAITLSVHVGSLIVCASLPWILIDGYGYAKLVAVLGVALASAYIGVEWVSKLSAVRQRSWAVAGASMLALSLGATVWLWTKPMAERFGTFSRKSIVGVAVEGVAAGAGADEASIVKGAAEHATAGTHPSTRPPALPEVSTDRAPALQPPTTAPEPSEHAPHPQIRHVIIVVVDSLRADILNDPSLRQKFPFLNRLEAESVRFANAYAPGNSTRLSLGPMLTGLPSPVMAAMADKRDLRQEALEANWLGRAIDEEGHSALIIASPFSWMLGDRFDVPAKVVVADGKTTETGHSSPRLETHFEALVDRGFFDGGGPTITAAFVADPHREYRCKDGQTGGYECYLEEIEVVDEALEQIYRLLDQEGILEQSMLVVTADHGESFGQMHYHGHTNALHQAQIRVALTMRLPGAEHRVVEPAVSLQALPATVADALDVRLASPQAYSSLLGLATGHADRAHDPILVERWSGYHDDRPVHQTAFIDDQLKLTYDWHTGHTTLVDLSKPVEAGSDLAGDRPGKVAELVERMFEWRRRQSRLSVPAALRSADP